MSLFNYRTGYTGFPTDCCCIVCHIAISHWAFADKPDYLIMHRLGGDQTTLTLQTVLCSRECFYRYCEQVVNAEVEY